MGKKSQPTPLCACENLYRILLFFPNRLSISLMIFRCHVSVQSCRTKEFRLSIHQQWFVCHFGKKIQLKRARVIHQRNKCGVVIFGEICHDNIFTLKNQICKSLHYINLFLYVLCKIASNILLQTLFTKELFESQENFLITCCKLPNCAQLFNVNN